MDENTLDEKALDENWAHEYIYSCAQVLHIRAPDLPAFSLKVLHIQTPDLQELSLKVLLVRSPPYGISWIYSPITSGNETLG